MFDINGKSAVVTGGASGIGLATVKALLNKGAKVVFADLDESTGADLEKELNELGEAVFVNADVSKEEDVKNAIDTAVEKFGSLDILFNNAGIGAQGSVHETSYEDYQKVIKVNQDGVFFGIKHGAKAMLNNEDGGAIVNTSSILGTSGEPTAFVYNASKGAVNLMTRSAALQYAKDGIRVNSVSPGYVESGMVNREALGDYYESLVDRHPIGRLGTAEELAHSVIYLIENTNTTGEILHVDGGYTAQ